ncbi:MAG: PAS domain S-box protein [Desulfobacteraceae bacterium]|nr:PAS domain S-box protein [Desulfobacteraceae bacterium]
MDITTREEYLLKAIDTLKRKVLVISPDFTILGANRYVMDNLMNDITGDKCYLRLHGRSAPCENCPAQNVIDTVRPTLIYHDTLWHPPKSICLYSYPLFSGQELDAVVLLDFDTPVLECLEESLERSNAFLRNLILSAVDGVIAADMKGRVFIFNEAASEISGHSVDEAWNNMDIRNFYPDNGAREVMRKLRCDEYGGKGKLKSCHMDVLSKNGETVPISLDAAIVYEDDDEVATIGFFHDLREKIRMKKELEKTQIQLLQAEKMASLGKLAAGVAHQLNNPLGGIILFTKLIIEEYDLEPGIFQDLDRILKDAQRCRDTVKELLEFARQTQHEMRPVDINRAICRTLFLLESQPLFQNVEIVRQLDPSLPTAPADIQQLNHVFMNIILNAAQAMDGNGKLTVATSLTAEKNIVRIEISDTGPGIPEDILPHIFDPFFTTKEEGKGTGLGLSLVYRIVENHGGKITAENKSGQGAEFIIELKTEHQEDVNDE